MALLELWQGWSGARSDTRTQAGKNFEHYYLDHQGMLGYILSEPVEGHTIPVYNAWSSGRDDTQFQIGDHRDPEYDGDIVPTGHIYKPPRGNEQPRWGTVPLYRAYNGARKDNRVQVGDSFEPGYENPILLGYIPSHEMVLESIDFHDMDLATQMVKYRPKHVHMVSFQNNTSAAQQQSFSFEDSQTNTQTFTTSSSVTAGLQVSVESTEGVPDTVEMKESMSVSLSATLSKESTRQKSETITKRYEFPMTIPPNSMLTAQAILYVRRIKLPYTATLRLVGTNIRHSFQGVYHGVHTSDAVIHLEESAPKQAGSIFPPK